MTQTGSVVRWRAVLSTGQMVSPLPSAAALGLKGGPVHPSSYKVLATGMDYPKSEATKCSHV